MRWIYVLASLLICSTAWADEPAPEEPPVVDEGPSSDEPAPEPAAPPGDESAPTEATGTPARMIRRAAMSYPEVAKRKGIQGTVFVRIFIETNGKFVPRKDPDCRWSSLSKQERRESFFDKRWCIEAISGPDALRAETVIGWASAARFEPATDASGTAIRSYMKTKTTYSLKRFLTE